MYPPAGRSSLTPRLFFLQMLTISECIYPDPGCKPKRRIKTAEHIKALESRLKDIESKVEGSGHPKRADSSHGVNSETRQSFSPVQSTPDESTYDDGDKFRRLNNFVLTRHAIEEGEAGYQGYSADRAFIQRLREKLKNWQGAEVHRRFRAPESELPKLFEPDYGLAATTCLPSKERSRALIDAALDSQSLFPILHRPSFDYTWNLVYTIEPAQYTVAEIRFLPLLYAVLALGCIFSHAQGQKSSREYAAAEGQVFHTTPWAPSSDLDTGCNILRPVAVSSTSAIAPKRPLSKH